MTTSAAEIRDPASELRKASGSLKRAHLADQLATGVFYVVSGAFVLLLIFFTLYVVWAAFRLSDLKSSPLRQRASVISSSTPYTSSFFPF